MDHMFSELNATFLVSQIPTIPGELVFGILTIFLTTCQNQQLASKSQLLKKFD